RASDPQTLFNLFEAKFSEALKTVGKRFDFEELYDNRENFKQEILKTIGSDLNGYALDDCAIDYLEQTPVQFLSENNILDAQGIKKIIELTAAQKVKANFIRREEEKTIKEQNVEAREAILEYERQLAEKEERQKREVANIKAREGADIAKTQEEQRLISEMVRIKTEEELAIAEEQKMRQVVIATKNKERAQAVESERVEKDRALEQTERERIIALAEIEKQRAIEQERKNIQDVIRDRIMVEKKTVEEEEKIKDTRELATANRAKHVAVIKAEETGESNLIEKLKEAEATKLAAEVNAETLLIDAEATKNAAEKEAEARKISAEAKAAEEAALGMSEAQVIEAKAKAKEREGLLEAVVIEKKAEAEAAGITAKTEALRKQGQMEAEVLHEKGKAEASILEEKMLAEAKGVAEKAKALKNLEGTSKEHEEFRLRLEQEKEIALASIETQRDISQAQAGVLGEAFKKANIDIIGGEQTFVSNIMSAVSGGKAIDGFVSNSTVLNEVKGKLLNGNSFNNGGLASQLKNMLGSLGVSYSDIRNLTLMTLLLQMQKKAGQQQQPVIQQLIDKTNELNLGDTEVEDLL
ncbi:MAG: flotillin family protein, partial [Bacteroidetes bacterium]